MFVSNAWFSLMLMFLLYLKDKIMYLWFTVLICLYDGHNHVKVNQKPDMLFGLLHGIFQSVQKFFCGLCLDGL